MQESLKKTIVTAANEYMAQKEMAAGTLSQLSGVSESYLSAMLNGKVKIGETVIADKWWGMLASAVGVSLQKEYWRPIETSQLVEMAATLETARENCRAATIICNTGMGKTYTIPMFQRKYPKEVIVIVLNSLVRLYDIIDMLCDRLNIPISGSKAVRLVNIITKLRELRRAGLKPTIIFDEAENMEHSVLKMLKGLFDGLLGFASIILIGTSELKRKMERANNSAKDAGPQFYRRFKAGIVEINTVVEYEKFFDAFGIKDKTFRSRLMHMCNNYGELHDYLEPVIRECDEQNVPVTYEYFKLIHKHAA